MKRKAKKAVPARRPKSLKNTQLKKVSGGYSDNYLWDEYKIGRDTIRDGRTF